MAEMAAIAEGLATALSQILLRGDEKSASDKTVVIFSDCQEALRKVHGLRQGLIISLCESW